MVGGWGLGVSGWGLVVRGWGLGLNYRGYATFFMTSKARDSFS